MNQIAPFVRPAGFAGVKGAQNPRKSTSSTFARLGRFVQRALLLNSLDFFPVQEVTFVVKEQLRLLNMIYLVLLDSIVLMERRLSRMYFSLVKLDTIAREKYRMPHPT
jgi:hypothetical protein